MKQLVPTDPAFTKRVIIIVTVTLIIILAMYKLGLINLEQSATVSDFQDGQKMTEVQDFENELSFLPHSIDYCEDLVITGHTEFTPAFQQELDAFNERLTRVLQLLNISKLEGHSGWFKNQQLATALLVQLSFIRTVCETGFNAGHSTLVYLTFNPDVHVYSFDLGNHEYSQYMADYLRNRFRNRLNVTWGDSTKTIKEFRKNFPNVICDLISIDGGHTTEVASADFSHFKTMAADRNLLLFDDYPQRNRRFDTIGSLWENKKRSGEVAELFRCAYNISVDTYFGHGFSLGRYVQTARGETRTKINAQL